MTRKEIGAVLQAIRIKKGYTQAQASKLLGRPQQTLAAWEIGRSQPDANTLFELFRLYGESFDEAFGFGPSTDSIPVYGVEKELILAYRSHPDMQPAVRRLLGLDNAVPSDHTPPASSSDAAASLHRDPGDPAFREEIVRYAITQMRELEPDAYNRVFHGAPLEDAIARSLAHDPDDIADSDPPADQKQA